MIGYVIQSDDKYLHPGGSLSDDPYVYLVKPGHPGCVECELTIKTWQRVSIQDLIRGLKPIEALNHILDRLEEGTVRRETLDKDTDESSFNWEELR